MDETQRETNAATRSEAEGEGALASGTEVNLGDFTRTQGLVKSLRLTIEQQVVVAVDDIAGSVGDAGRKFKLGDLEQAHQDVVRLYSAFGQRTGQWESQARGLEQQLRMQAAKDPKSVSIDRMNRMKSEQTAVRSRIRTAEVQFRRLHQTLEHAFTMLQNSMLQNKAAAARSMLPIELPPGFLDAFQHADAASRPAIVRDYFEVESTLKANVARGAQGGYQIKFEPTPPQGRLYFFTSTGQAISLRQLGSMVSIYDVESCQESELKLFDFVKQVQAGVWLLRPRA